MKPSFSSINDIFSSIAPEYDFMNNVMSLGLHHLWKSIFVEQLPLNHRTDSFVYVDMACGTGDIGGRVLQKAKEENISILPIFADPNIELLSIAQNRFPDPRIQWRQESCENLSLSDACIDLYTISFGLRNVTHRHQSLKKAWDVLVPGGQFWCLEFSHPENPWIQEAFYAYLKILPLLGQGVIGQSEPYAYLARSIRDFPSKHVLSSELYNVGFSDVTHEALSHGIVTITKGIK